MNFACNAIRCKSPCTSPFTEDVILTSSLISGVQNDFPPRNGNKERNAREMLTKAKKLMDLGFKLVILRPGDKVPLTLHGVKDATNDFSTFMCLSPASGEYNIGSRRAPPATQLSSTWILAMADVEGSRS